MIRATSFRLSVVVAALVAACGGAPAPPQTTASDADAPYDLVSQMNYLALCLEGKGIAAEVDPETGVMTVVDRGQEEFVAAETETCLEEAREEGIFPPIAEITRESIQDIYEKLVSAEECLERLGFSIEDPPSQDVFIDTYESGQEPWHPYLYLPDDLDEGQMEKVAQECPAWQ